jgi:hypothetical protein
MILITMAKFTAPLKFIIYLLTNKLLNMKSVVRWIIVLLTVLNLSFDVDGQETSRTDKKTVVYSFAVNIVPDRFNFPLIGFVNLANGSQKNAQVGFNNWNQNDFAGAQVGFINIAGGNVTGAQVGFIGTCGNSLKGVQLSFVNAVKKSVNGAQVGFVNASDGPFKGLQSGFVNAIGENVMGSQIGFVNLVDGDFHGFQMGFVNGAKTLKGFQLGFVNFVNRIEKGFPLGFLSFVKEGGYRAIEISVTEMYPVNLSFKTGMKGFYTSVIASYNPDLKTDFAVGLGIGSNIPFSKSVYINPEISVQSDTGNNYQQTFCFATNLGFCLIPKLHFTIGPSLVWNHADNPDDLTNPVFSLYRNTINENNNLVIGVRVALKYVLTDW